MPTSIIELFKEFAETLQKELLIYIIIIINLVTALNLNKNNVTPILPTEYAVYIDIFSNKKIRRLLLYKQNNHAINLNRKNPLYKPLYNLSIYKLKELRDYLDNVLTKN